MKIHLFIQARLGSTRLKDKVFLKILGKTMFELLVERMKRVEGVDEIFLVTGPRDMHQPLIDEATRLEVKSFSGNEENLLDRFYQASNEFDSDLIIRINADNPLMDPGVISKALAAFLQSPQGICLVGPGYPRGLGFEMFSKDALEKTWRAKKEEGNTDKKFAGFFLEVEGMQKKEISYERDLSGIRLTVDYEEDFKVAEKIYEALYPANPEFGMQDILGFLERNPDVLEINRKYAI